ncbi:MogA/MoaB family molybdenum cofactor biosynthesis protein [Bacillus suaedaesalsae]|uniref:Molybdenum cofactor biosynthesis protein B n=1 Tax=Bacillus suaedaesalsae TaxID=2810349 RepID=A0ABS2DHE8_9BACI|nr:MogA/MoaB family molybdenum cofactor biosynthesis protein [Bacillus suaedaesalsae]MBM6617460.1 MogA/MoaB family molybdenum cofactor biosynthesis protein [Bacillus suaedaesalsae]
MSLIEHKTEAPEFVRCKIITVSDTRTLETDKSGHLIKDLLLDAGHQIVNHVIVKDEVSQIRDEVISGSKAEDVEMILLNGGTGISQRDVTIETIVPLFDKEIVGFGEIFRHLSYTEDIGSAAIMSRAVAGTRNRTGIFAMPGSTGAVRLAMQKLVLPELQHVVRELKK